MGLCRSGFLRGCPGLRRPRTFHRLTYTPQALLSGESSTQGQGLSGEPGEIKAGENVGNALWPSGLVPSLQRN